MKNRKKSKIFKMICTLCIIAAAIAEVYFIINYRDMYPVIGAIAVVILVASGFLMSEMMNENESEGSEVNLDEIIRLQKALYVSNKNLSQEISARLTENADSIAKAIEENSTNLIENEKNIAKVIIKKNVENSEEVIKAINDFDFSKVQLPEVKIPDISIPEINIPEIKLPEIPAAQTSDVESARKEIITLINSLSDSIKSIAKVDDLVKIKDQLSEEINAILSSGVTVDSVTMETANEDDGSGLLKQEDIQSLENLLFEEPEPEPEAEPEPEPGAEPEAEPEPEPEAEPEPEPAEDPNRQLTPDEIAAMFASAAATEPVAAVEEEDDMEEILNAMSDPEPEPEISFPDLGDDPNKQLSPDEIAALFASIQ